MPAPSRRPFDTLSRTTRHPYWICDTRKPLPCLADPVHLLVAETTAATTDVTATTAEMIGETAEEMAATWTSLNQEGSIATVAETTATTAEMTEETTDLFAVRLPKTT